MFKLLTVYIVSILLILATLVNANIYSTTMKGRDYFFLFTPGLNTIAAVMVIAISLDKVQKIHQIQK